MVKMRLVPFHCVPVSTCLPATQTSTHLHSAFCHLFFHETAFPQAVNNFILYSRHVLQHLINSSTFVTVDHLIDPTFTVMAINLPRFLFYKSVVANRVTLISRIHKRDGKPKAILRLFLSLISMTTNISGLSHLQSVQLSFEEEIYRRLTKKQCTPCRNTRSL